jgi:glycosyltransferase involved in cell wall biosynthesis
MAASPTISIGMPVYNAENYIRSALDSLLTQTYTNFELIISDNASTDSTSEICATYMERDSRIRYIRQPTNLGATANFRLVLLQSTAPYFMWAAADDIRSPDFLAANLSFLEQHAEYVASISPVKFSGGDFDPMKMGDAALDDDDPNQRIIKPFSKWHANGRFYSVFRRKPVAEWPHLNDMEFLGSDWTLITHLAAQGKLNRVASGCLELGTKGMSNTTDIFALYRKRRLHWVLPFYTVTVDTFRYLKKPRFSQTVVLLMRLFRLNWKAVRKQLRAWRKTRFRQPQASVTNS